jgi:serine/threonine-protein kinase
MLVFAQTFASGKSDYDQSLTEADAEAKAALKIAPDLQSGNVALAMSRASRLDFKGALSEYRKAFPDDSPVTDNIAEYSRFLSQVGLTSDGFELADRGISADPLNPRAHQSKVWAFYCAHRYPEAVKTARELLQWAPNRPTTLSRLGDSLLLMGKLDEAQAAYAKCDLEYPARLVGEAMLAARAGNRAASDAALAKLRQLYGETAGYRIAGVHAQRGEKDLAIAALSRAILVRDSGVTTLPTDPFIDPLRGDARFKQLTSKLDFPS